MTPPAPFPAGCSVLLAEDHAGLRELLASSLRAQGFSVISASDGAEALAYLAEARMHPDVTAVPDLIITDIHMPRRSGFDLLTIASVIGVPAIVMTAYGDAWSRRMATRLGAAGFLDKPIAIDSICDAALAALAGAGHEV